jgi:thioredoxin-related protein
VTDFDTAKTAAASEEKIIMMSFQGSDWCSNCRRLEKTLFDNEEFKTYADGNLILLKVDFPAKKENRLSKEQTAHNDELAEQYNPNGSFPLVLFFNEAGEKIGELPYPQKDVAAYIASMKKIKE